MHTEHGAVGHVPPGWGWAEVWVWAGGGIRVGFGFGFGVRVYTGKFARLGCRSLGLGLGRPCAPIPAHGQGKCSHSKCSHSKYSAPAHGLLVPVLVLVEHAARVLDVAAVLLLRRGQG